MIMKNKISSTRKHLNKFYSHHRGRINRTAGRVANTIKTGMLSLGLFGFVLGAPGAALAANLPTGAQVVSGDVNINQIGSDTMRILQGSQSAIVNWQSFDIGRGALVDIVQPNVDSAMLSRVIGNNLSEIYGTLNSNGQLYLINPNGILFGDSAQVNVYSLVASTLDLADSDFLTGNIHFTGDSEASVINLGTINSESFTALIAGDVQNLGDIIAPGGDVALLSGDALIEVGEAAGGKITMDLSGLLGGSASNSGSIDASSADLTGGSVTIIGESVSNSGSIDASGATGGGEVLIGGDYQGNNPNISNAQNTIVSGEISADALENGDGGRVIVWADDTTDFSGVISVVGGASFGNGGFVETSGKNILKFTGSVDATAQNGETGDLLLDPIDITITTASTSGIQNTSSTWESDDTTGSSMLNVSDLLASLSSANVTISTQQNSSGQTAPAGGDITVSTAIDNSGNNNNLTLVAGEDISIFFPITMGASGDLTLQAGQRSDIDSGAVLATAALTANDLVVEADTGITIINSVVDSMNLTINQTGGVNVSNTQAFTLTANSNSNNITASTSNGDLSIASVNAGSGTVDLTASGGNILDFTPSDDASVNITASTVSLSGSTGVGSSGLGDIDTTASTLELSTTSSGSIFVADTDAVTLASSSTSSGGNIDVRTVSGDLTVSSAVTADGSGDITLNSAGSTIINNVITSTSGDLSVTGATGVTHSAAGDLTTSGSGTITVSATANDVTMADGTVYTAGGGAVSVTGADEVLLGKISNPLGTVAVTATAGDISDETAAEGSSNENIGGTTVTLASATGIGATGSANDIDIAATTIVASDSGSGGIYLTETDDLAIGATSTTAGAISISAGGAVTTSGNITAAGGALNITGVDVTNTNTITGDSNGLTIDAGTGTLTSTAGNITNGGSAGSIILAADTDIVLGGGAGAITGGSGNITLKDSSGSVSIGIEGGAGTISLADSDLDEITTSGAIIIGDASSGAITIGGAIQPSGSEALQFSGSSVALNANVTSANADITFVPAVTVGAGVTIDSGAGAGDITFSSTLDGGQAVVLDAGSGGINFNGVVGATALTSLATTGTTGSISIGQNVTTTGVQTYTGPVTLSGSPTLATTDSLVTFSGDVSGAGALTVTSGTGGLTFGSTIGAGVNITSLSTSGTTGNITLGGDIDSDGTLSFSGPVLLAADATITTSDDLVTFSDALDNAQNLVVTTGSGGITFTGIVGGTTPLTSLLTTGTTGTITLGGNVNTTGTQNYVGPVSFNSDIALNVTGGTDSDDVSFGSTVTATSDSLDINVANSGDVNSRRWNRYGYNFWN